MIFFSKLNPAATDPRLIVNREHERRWLSGSLQQYLGNNDPENGRAYCVSGGKGVGKSILTRRVLDELRQVHSATTVFIEVDCRRCQSRRTVVARIAQGLLKELNSLKVKPELLSTAHILATIANFDSAKLKIVHQHIVQHRRAARLAGERSLLNFLALNFDISFDRTEKQQKALEGDVRFDAHRLLGALIELFHDVRRQGLHIVVYLDNIDELDHAAYRSEERREAVRTESEGLLELYAAPIALVLNMRTYYTDVLPRAISKVRVLEPLAGDDMLELLRLRMREEPAEINEALANPECRDALAKLAGLAKTPLAFLTWFEFLCEQGAPHSDSMTEGLGRFARTHFAALPSGVLRSVAAAFPTYDSMISREQLLAACNGNEAVFSQVQQHQVVLPVDFWNPIEFMLDPLLHFMLPSDQAR